MQALLLLLGIGLSTHRAGRAHSKKLIAAPLLILLVLAGILFIRGGDGARGLPPGYTGTAYSLLYGYERSTDVVAPRGPVRLPLVRPLNGDGDIVLLVDESISGQYLDINSDRGIYSGLKAPGNGVAVHNFGLVVSIAHCSAAVNYTLRHGGARDDYVRINGTMPSIWSYARKAGLETVYIDVPRTNRIFNNMMDEAEAKDIDRWIQFDDHLSRRSRPESARTRRHRRRHPLLARSEAGRGAGAAGGAAIRRSRQALWRNRLERRRRPGPEPDQPFPDIPDGARVDGL